MWCQWIRVAPTGVLVFIWVGACLAQEPAAGLEPWQLTLNAGAAKDVQRLESSLQTTRDNGDLEVASQLADDIVAIRRTHLGASHWQTGDAERLSEELRLRAKFSKAQQAAYDSLVSTTSAADAAFRANDLSEALRLFEAAAGIAAELFGAESLPVTHLLPKQAQCQLLQSHEQEATALVARYVKGLIQRLGADHPQVASAWVLVSELSQRSDRFQEAVAAYERALEIRRRTLGPQSIAVGDTHNRLGLVLMTLSRYAESQSHFERGLAALESSAGPHSRDVLSVLLNLADCLRAQGRVDDAEPLLARALEIAPDPSPERAVYFNVSGLNRLITGRAGEAEVRFRKSLAMWQRLSSTARSEWVAPLNNLANALASQGRYLEAHTYYLETLDVARRTSSERHRHFATACNNLATNLLRRGLPSEAQPYFERCLKIRAAVLEQDHPDTGQAHFNLALNLLQRDKPQDAKPHLERAVRVFEARLGDHADTALGCRELGSLLSTQGDFAAAEPLLRRAEQLHRAAWGMGHADAAQSAAVLAQHFVDQGRDDDAAPWWRAATEGFEQARRRIAFTGLGRAARSAEFSPFEPWAAAQARQGQFTAAWVTLERSLSRGLLDDIVLRRDRQLSAIERPQQRLLAARLRHIQTQLGLANSPSGTVQARESWRMLESQVQTELVELEQRWLSTAGVQGGQAATLEEVQRLLTPETAMVAWLDLPGREHAKRPTGEHWAVIVRHQGEPHWIDLVAERGDWTPDDDFLGSDLAALLTGSAGRAPAQTFGQVRDQIRELRQQRFEPLRGTLAADKDQPPIKRLIVLPSPALRGVPIELLADEGLTISYAPSATVLRWLRNQQRDQPIAAGRWFGLGDPVFTVTPSVSRPDNGMKVTQVVAHGAAAEVGIEPDDILLSYAGKLLSETSKVADIQRQLAAEVKTIEVEFWRQGDRRKVTIPVGKLGVSLTPIDAEIKRSSRAVQPFDLMQDQFAALPGTQLEVRAIAQSVPGAQSNRLVLLKSDASEQQLTRLVATGELARFRWLHLATHGVPDADLPLRSRLILSRDRLSSMNLDGWQDAESYRGELSAERVVRDWELNADLVVLSACQSGLGRFAGGEGYIGFAQALFLSGARSLVLSLWKVDDQATALLMKRFYENLWAARPELKAPHSKAAALAEAKSWLRTLSRTEADHIWSNWQTGNWVTTASADGDPNEARPFEHPTYWAAFVLIGADD